MKGDQNTDDIDPEIIVQAFVAKNHPDVIAGVRSAEDVHTEFLETFDVGGEVEGRVTRSEFENYYANVGACIEEDAVFEAILRGVWTGDIVTVSAQGSNGRGSAQQRKLGQYRSSTDSIRTVLESEPDDGPVVHIQAVRKSRSTYLNIIT